MAHKEGQAYERGDDRWLIIVDGNGYGNVTLEDVCCQCRNPETYPGSSHYVRSADIAASCFSRVSSFQSREEQAEGYGTEQICQKNREEEI